jgi:hypothetical protein
MNRDIIEQINLFVSLIQPRLLLTKRSQGHPQSNGSTQSTRMLSVGPIVSNWFLWWPYASPRRQHMLLATHNISELHTGDDCSTPAGCVVEDSSPVSFGAGFAAAGGGVWAAQFDVSGVLQVPAFFARCPILILAPIASGSGVYAPAFAVIHHTD